MFKFFKKRKRAAFERKIAELARTAVESGQIDVKILADSISRFNKRITTFQLRYPRFFHAEFMTHRVFGRNASSSRAIPVKLILKQVWNNPAHPWHWGANQGGMQAKTEVWGIKRLLAMLAWKYAGRCACIFAWMLMKLGVHKQVSNRILEPWQFIHVVVTATEYANFYELRDHDDAQPEFHVLAYLMRQAQNNSKPELLEAGQWHLPYITKEERSVLDLEVQKRVSAARCCRVSYMKHDGTQATVCEDLKLCDRLVGARPLHASPFEHQATPDVFEGRTEQWKSPAMHGNLQGWNQYRKYIEVEMWSNAA